MKPRVLIVDDEPDVLELVDFKLSGEGFEVVRAATGLEALRKARCESPSVVVLDLMLPDLDGLVVCQILRAQPSTRDVPVVVLSALDRPITRSRGSKIRVSHWLKKGSGLDSLSDCVRAAFREHLERVRRRLNAEQPSCSTLVGATQSRRLSK
jgi:two-component system, OmpR family, alkaline phosphatase synthesis response regulator PhoP